MALKFSANLSTMFTHVELKDRFDIAREFGFDTFELQNPYVESPDVLKDRKGIMRCDLINLYSESSFGCAARPGGQDDFYNATQKAAAYYFNLGFKKLHIMSGEVVEKYSPEEQFDTLVQSLQSLVSSDYLENINVTGLIEPMCSEVNPKYYLNNFELAIDVLKEVDSDQIKLLLDVYHLHKITGDVKKNLDKYYSYAGHIQVSQVPDRTAPFTERGVIDYEYVFEYLSEKKHADYIGLEYFTPEPISAKSFDWMKKYRK